MTSLPIGDANPQIEILPDCLRHHRSCLPNHARLLLGGTSAELLPAWSVALGRPRPRTRTSSSSSSSSPPQFRSCSSWLDACNFGTASTLATGWWETSGAAHASCARRFCAEGCSWTDVCDFCTAFSSSTRTRQFGVQHVKFKFTKFGGVDRGPRHFSVTSISQQFVGPFVSLTLTALLRVFVSCWFAT